MDSRKVNLHYQKVGSVQMKEKLRGNAIWGQEYMFLCLKDVKKNKLEKIIEELILERAVSRVF